MKASVITTLNVLFTLFLFLPGVYTQNTKVISGDKIQKVTPVDSTVITIIDVKGSRYTDKMWIFSIPQCTRNFEQGWDGYKMFNSTKTPQLFAIEEDGNFQVNSIPDMNKSYLGFRAGEDTSYTLTFTHYNLELSSKELYLVDLLENKVVDIYASGSQYTFVAHHTFMPVKRFEIVTSLSSCTNTNNAKNAIVNREEYVKTFNTNNSIYVVEQNEAIADL